jgi:fused signal recognition particle receptor
MLTVYPHWDNGTVSEGLWIAIAVIAVLVVAAVVVFGLVRSRRGKISLDSSTSTDTATPVDKSGGYTASSPISFTQSSVSAPTPPPTEAPPERIDTSGLPAVGDDATLPRDAPNQLLPRFKRKRPLHLISAP